MESGQNVGNWAPKVRGKGTLTLVVQQLFSRLSRVLRIGALDNGIHRAGFLAEAAVDALRHVDIVAGRSAGSIGSLLGLDGDGLGGADLGAV